MDIEVDVVGKDLEALLYKEGYDKLKTALWNFCYDMGQESDFYDYEIAVDEENKLVFIVSRTMSFQVAEEEKLDKYITIQEFSKIFAHHKLDSSFDDFDAFLEQYNIEADELFVDEDAEEASKKLRVEQWSEKYNKWEMIDDYEFLEEVTTYMQSCFPKGQDGSIQIREGMVKHSYSLPDEVIGTAVIEKFLIDDVEYIVNVSG
jgi:hypothetical protein